MSLAVSEVFGPTIQGEGPSAGRRCGFIRLGLCNLDCAWCDTPYTWDWSGKNGVAYDREKELRRAEVDQLVRLVEDMDVPMCVISGGEPMVQRAQLTELVVALHAVVERVEIETNGTITPSDLLMEYAHFNVSPKLAHALCSKPTINTDALRTLSRSNRAVFKFVCGEPSDLEEVSVITTAVGIPDSQVWIMPEGRTATRLSDVTGALVDDVVLRGWNMTSRLHVLAWGDVRGV